MRIDVGVLEKREEGRGKREEGRGKREEGRGKREEVSFFVLRFSFFVFPPLSLSKIAGTAGPRLTAR
jgi:hypothetical protein